MMELVKSEGRNAWMNRWTNVYPVRTELVWMSLTITLAIRDGGTRHGSLRYSRP